MSIEIDGCKFRIGIIANNFSEIIYAERIKSNYSGHELKTSSFFEEILQITNYDLKIKFIDKAGKILLSTYINDDKHKNRGLDVQKCNKFAYINVNGEWQKYDSNLNLIQRIPEWNNCRVEAFPCGQYSYINIHSSDGFSGDDKDNIKQYCLFNPSGEVVYSDKNGNIQHMRFLKDADYFYLEKYGCTGADLTHKKTKVFFYKEKYLFDIVESRHYDNVFLSAQKNIFAAFIANGGVNGQNYGLVDSDFEIILPFVFEDIRVGNDFAIVRSNGREGVVNRHGDIIIQLLYSNIYSVGNFFLASTKGQFPTEFSDMCFRMRRRGCSYSEVKTKRGEGGDYYIFYSSGELSINKAFAEVYSDPSQFCEHTRCRDNYIYTPQLDILQVIEKKSDEILYGLIDINGSILLAPKWKFLDFVYNREGYDETPIGMIFSSSAIAHWDESDKIYKYRNCKLGFMSLDGQEILSEEFDSIICFGKYLRTRKGDKYGLYSIDGAKFLDNIYTFISFMAVGKQTNVVCYNIDGLWSINSNKTINFDGLDHVYSVEIEAKFPSSGNVSYQSGGINIIGGKWGYYNLMRGVNSEASYDEVHSFWRDNAIVKKDAQYYIIGWDLKIKGGPYDYIKIGRYKSNNYPHEDYQSDDYNDSEKDTWYALTDGQYGDYPGDNYDMDHLMDSLGY